MFDAGSPSGLVPSAELTRVALEFSLNSPLPTASIVQHGALDSHR